MKVGQYAPDAMFAVRYSLFPCLMFHVSCPTFNPPLLYLPFLETR